MIYMMYNGSYETLFASIAPYVTTLRTFTMGGKLLAVAQTKQGSADRSKLAAVSGVTVLPSATSPNALSAAHLAALPTSIKLAAGATMVDLLNALYAEYPLDEFDTNGI